MTFYCYTATEKTSLLFQDSSTSAALPERLVLIPETRDHYEWPVRAAGINKGPLRVAISISEDSQKH